MAKKKNFVNYKGHKIPRNIVNDMYVYDNFLMSNNPDNVSPKYYSKNSDIHYGSTLDFYVDQIEKGMNPTDVQNDFTNEFSGIVKEYGYLDNNFLDRYETKINESNEIRNNIFETQKKYPDKKWYEPQFSYNNKNKKYQETLQGYRNQYKEKLDKIIPSFKNIDDMKLTPQQEFAKQYIELQKNGNEAIFEMNADILNKQGIGDNYDVSKKISDELTILQFPELEDGVKTRKTYGEYLNNVFDTLGEMYDIENLTKNKNGKYDFKMNQQYIDNLIPEINDLIKNNNLIINNDINNNTKNNIKVNNEYDPYNGLSEKEITEYRKMYDDWQRTLPYTVLNNSDISKFYNGKISNYENPFNNNSIKYNYDSESNIPINESKEEINIESITDDNITTSNLEKENIENKVINNVSQEEINESIKNAKEFEKEILSNNEEIEPTIVEEKIESIIQNKNNEDVVDNSGIIVEKDDSVVTDNSGTVIEKDEPIVSNKTDEIVSSDNNETIEEKIQDINNENKSNVIEAKPNETIVTTGSDDTVITDTNGENVVTSNQEETITTNNNYDDLENVVVEKTISDDGKETVKITGNPTKNNTKKFNYGKNGENTTTVDDIVKNIYGNQADGDSAKNFVINKLNNTKGGKDYLKDKEIFEDGYVHGNLKVDKNNKALGQSVGSVLADKNYSKIVDSNGNINSSKITEIADQYKEFGGLDNVDTGIEKQVRRSLFQKEYDKVGAKFLDYSKNLNREEENIKDILKKIEKNERLTDPKEIEAFKHYQESIQKSRNEMIEFAEKLGYTAESVFGEGFNFTSSERKKRKNNKKNLKNFNDIIGETDDDGNTRALNFNRKSFNNVNNKSKWLDYDVDDDGNFTKKSIEEKNKMKEDLKEVFEFKDQDFYQANEEFKKGNVNYLDYLGENKEALSDDTAKKLYNLQQKDGVDIGDEGRQVLQGLAIAHEGKLDNKNGAVTKLNTALETLSSENYMNIKDDNMDRIGKGLVYKDNKYQLDMDKLNLTDEQKNSEAFKKIIESDNVGTEDLKGIFDASTVNNYIQGKNIDEKEFNKIIGEKVSGLEDSKYNTGLNIKEQLKKRGIEDNKIIDEIANAKNNGTDNLSAEAKVAIATLKDPLDQNEINFGSINKDKIKEYINNNKGFFGDPKDIENMNEKELYGLFGKAFEGTVTDGKLAKGYDFKVKGKDVTTAEGFTDFYNSVLGKDGKDLDWDKVFSSLGATEEGKAQFKDAFEWMKGKKGQKEFKQMNIANSARDYLVKMFDEASGNENIDAKTKEQIKKHAEILKTKKMDDVASKVDVDSITKDIGKFDKIGKEAGKGIVDSIKGGGKWKTIGGAALTLGGLGALGMFASNAAEERERKRQEMQQLMMAQNQSIRGGY